MDLRARLVYTVQIAAATPQHTIRALMNAVSATRRRPPPRRPLRRRGSPWICPCWQPCCRRDRPPRPASAAPCVPQCPPARVPAGVSYRCELNGRPLAQWRMRCAEAQAVPRRTTASLRRAHSITSSTEIIDRLACLGGGRLQSGRKWARGQAEVWRQDGLLKDAPRKELNVARRRFQLLVCHFGQSGHELLRTAQPVPLRCRARRQPLAATRRPLLA